MKGETVLEWSDYLKSMISEESVLDNLQLTIIGETEPTCVPPIIKASILMLDRITSVQGKYNIFVFPERIQSVFIFAIMKSMYNIAKGEIERDYNPESFVKGEKLKFKNCVIAFNRIDIQNGTPYLWIDTADCTVGAPIEIVPFLQRTNTKRHLSKDREFSKAKKETKEQGLLMTSSEWLLASLSDYRTHISGSVFFVSSVINTQNQMRGCLINDKPLSDLILLGHANPDGEIKNLGVGQLTGNPAIVLASDLYSVINAHNNGASIQSVIVDISNPNMVSTQLNAIDELMRLNFPMIFVTNTVNSFDLQFLLDRGFNLWRWNEESITTELYGASSYILDKKVSHCANRKVEYMTVDGVEISEALKRLYMHRGEVQEQSPEMNNLFGKLFTLTFSALRNLVPTTKTLQEQMQLQLDECERCLTGERAFISPDTYSDYLQVINNLRIVYNASFRFAKIEELEKRFTNSHFQNVCVVIPERTNKLSCQEYWRGICLLHELSMNISIMFPSEYHIASNYEFDATIVAGWLSSNIMRNILHSYNTRNYIVLLYDYERRWKSLHISTWNRILSNESTKKIIRKSFSAAAEISVTRFKENTSIDNTAPQRDELAEIEFILRDNKYRKFVAHGDQQFAGEVIEAIPVNFVGGYLAFFKTSHKIVTATDIIVNDGDQIAMIVPADLKVGDFVVVREANRDVIRDIADAMLTNSSKSSCREISGKWKEALVVESLFSSNEDIYQKLKAAGCSKDFPTVRRWMTDEDVIAPQQKEDIIHIAKVTEDAVLMEIADQVFEAARTVRAAHMQAGKYLSSQLKSTMASELQSFGEIDPFNIWEPVSLTLENIGLVRILKVIDIGNPVLIDAGNANRLIEEM